MNSYVFNLETTKIELHFDKCDYDALTEKQKQELKSGFLWSNFGKCWISRAKEPNLWRAKQVAKELGFTGEERKGERISYAEQLEQKAERAEARAERYEEYSENATKRGERMQSELNSYSGDIAFFTQPNINSSGGRAFTNFREKLYNRYAKGFEEYRKSEYFTRRAETARETAEMSKLNDLGYIDRKIKECQKTIKKLEGYIIKHEETLYRIQQGEKFKYYDGTEATAENEQKSIMLYLERVTVAMDKQAFFENRADELGGIRFSKENIKVGDYARVRGDGTSERDWAKVVSVGPKNIKIVYSYFPCPLTKAYAEIVEVRKAVQND